VLQAVALTQGEQMILTPTYHVMKMYTVHHEAQLLPVNFESPDYTYNGESLPAVSVSASKKDGKVAISVVNIDSKKENQVEFDIGELDVEGMTATILTSDKLQDHNTFENEEKITPEEFKDYKLRRGKLQVTIPPFSVIVLESE
jgi:alpha-N-arabinofuranosidase